MLWRLVGAGHVAAGGAPGLQTSVVQVVWITTCSTVIWLARTPVLAEIVLALADVPTSKPSLMTTKAGGRCA